MNWDFGLLTTKSYIFFSKQLSHKKLSLTCFNQFLGEYVCKGIKINCILDVEVLMLKVRVLGLV